MKRLFRIVRTSLTCFSLILFLATAMLWFRSKTNLDEITISRPQRYVYFQSVESRFYYNHWTCSEPNYWHDSSIKFGGGELSRLKYGHIGFIRQFGPFAYGRASPNGPVFSQAATGHVFMFPHWIILLITGILPALSLRRSLKLRRTRNRLKNGLCQNCGYDLRSSPTRCPECGFEAAAPGDDAHLLGAR